MSLVPLLCSDSVLVVEDEPLLRCDTVDMIEDAGFRVHEAGNAEDALGVLEGRSDIKVLLTDIHMPGEIDGLDLARIVHKRWPHVAIIVVSGHVGADEAEIPGNGIFLSKPYIRSAVVKALRSAKLPH